MRKTALWKYSLSTFPAPLFFFLAKGFIALQNHSVPFAVKNDIRIHYDKILENLHV